MSLELKEIRLSLDDFAENMTVSEIKQYLMKEHIDTHINIFYNTVTALKDVPLELLCRIFLFDRSLSINSLLICKDINKYMTKMFYEVECDREISIKELKARLNDNYDGYTEYILFNRSLSYIENSITIYNSRMNKHISIDFVDVLIKGVHVNYFGEFDISDDTKSDIFSRYRSRRKRLSLMRYNPNYAKEYLIKEYKELIDIDYNIKNICSVMKSIIMISHIAHAAEPIIFKFDDNYICNVEPIDSSFLIYTELDKIELYNKLETYLSIIKKYYEILMTN